MLVYDDWRVRLYLQDNLSWLRQCADSCIDLVVTSPPYDDLRSYSSKQIVGRDAWSMARFELVARELGRVLKPGGVIVWNVNDSSTEGESGNSFRQALFFMEHCGLLLHDTMIYQKSNFSNPSTTRYHQVFEYVFILAKGRPKTFNPIKDRENVYAGKQGSYGKNTVTQKDGSKKLRPQKINTARGMRHNVWLMPTTGQTGESRKYLHPAMFSLQFAKDHIASWSNPGDIVLDPFMGSGTTACAALSVNRKVIGVEVSADYVNIQLQRMLDWREASASKLTARLRHAYALKVMSRCG